MILYSNLRWALLNVTQLAIINGTHTKDLGSSEGSVSPSQQVSMVSSCMIWCLIHFPYVQVDSNEGHVKVGVPHTFSNSYLCSLAVGLFSTDETNSSSNFKGTETGGLQWRPCKGRGAPYIQHFLLVFSLAVGHFSTEGTAWFSSSSKKAGIMLVKYYSPESLVNIVLSFQWEPAFKWSRQLGINLPDVSKRCSLKLKKTEKQVM